MNCFACHKTSNSSYIKWIIEILGPVLLGSKPSEIITIPKFDKDKDSKLKDIKSYFNICNKIQLIIIDMCDGSYKLLFINNILLSKTLKNLDIKYFLTSLGYPYNVDSKSYIDILIKKIKSSVFPDEIGIFLGYPLKDVKGFMGYGNYKLFNTRYWQVYGDPKVSYSLYLEFLNDRNKIRYMLKSKDINDILSKF